MRVKSTPSSSSSSSCAVSSIEEHSRVGHLYLPFSNRLRRIRLNSRLPDRAANIEAEQVLGNGVAARLC